MDWSWVSHPQSWIAFATLLALEVVLGIDNVIFISILAGKLPASQQSKARNLGLGLALITRVILLFSLSWIIGLTAPLFSLPFLSGLDPKATADAAHAAASGAAGGGHEVIGKASQVSGRDLILILGGLFLIGKSTHEIHNKLEGAEHAESGGGLAPSFTSVLVQILLLDVVFSLDSVITAVGMVDNIAIMISAVVVAIGAMMAFARPVSEFVERHPTVKILALSFLLLIGVTLLIEGFDQHISKGYIYFAMAFSVCVEMLNLKLRKPGKPKHLTDSHLPEIKKA